MGEVACGTRREGAHVVLMMTGDAASSFGTDPLSGMCGNSHRAERPRLQRPVLTQVSQAGIFIWRAGMFEGKK